MRSQVSLEYATTYGWAILIVVVIVGSLIYYGAIENERNKKTICNLGPQFVCEDIYITPDDVLGVKFYSQINDNITVDFSLNGDFSSADCVVNPSTLLPGDSAELICNLNKEVFSGETLSIETEAKFTSKATTINGISLRDFTASGIIISTVKNEFN